MADLLLSVLRPTLQRAQIVEGIVVGSTKPLKEDPPEYGFLRGAIRLQIRPRRTVMKTR